MNFVSYDGRSKRWYPKVARAAEEQVQDVLTSASYESMGDFFAEFDASTSGPPSLVERYDSEDIDRVIRFAARDWSTVESSVADAVNQLSSVLVAYSRDDALARVLEAAGCVVGTARITRERIEDDLNERASIVIESALSIDQFFTLVEQIESKLEDAGIGEVWGTGCGVGGWCIDLSAANVEPCVEFVSAELEQQNLKYDVNRY